MTDWPQWSREAVRLMQSRNALWEERFRLRNAAYRWDLDLATIVFERPDDDVVASITLIGTTSVAEGTFLWAWANGAIPSGALVGLESVRAFGARNDLPLLIQAEIQGGRPEALEMLAVAGRILDAEGVFIDQSADLGFFFALRDFRIERKK